MNAHEHRPLSDFITYSPNEMLARSQTFYADIKRRHSIRQFSARNVPRELIETCIQSAATAPSGANHQPWHFVAISSPTLKKQVREQAEAHEQRFYEGSAGEQWLEALKPLGTDAQKPYLETAPWLIAIFSQKKGGVEAGQKQQNYYIHESVGIATGILITALHNAGLATLTHTPKPMSFLSKICQRPDDERPYMLLVTGFPADKATVPAHALKKKTLDEIASFL
jgi:nitroreductase